MKCPQIYGQQAFGQANTEKNVWLLDLGHEYDELAQVRLTCRTTKKLFRAALKALDYYIFGHIRTTLIASLTS